MTHSLKALREEAGLTQVAVAAILGVSQPNISAVESGHYRTRVSTLAKFYAAIGRVDLVEPLLHALTPVQVRSVEQIAARFCDAVSASGIVRGSTR